MGMGKMLDQVLKLCNSFFTDSINFFVVLAYILFNQKRVILTDNHHFNICSNGTAFVASSYLIQSCIMKTNVVFHEFDSAKSPLNCGARWSTHRLAIKRPGYFRSWFPRDEGFDINLLVDFNFRFEVFYFDTRWY